MHDKKVRIAIMIIGALAVVWLAVTAIGLI